MAVSETKNPSALKIKLDCGMDNDGKTIVKSRTFSNLASSSAAQDVLDVANALVGLSTNQALEILKQDNTVLN